MPEVIHLPSDTDIKAAVEVAIDLGKQLALRGRQAKEVDGPFERKGEVVLIVYTEDLIR